MGIKRNAYSKRTVGAGLGLAGVVVLLLAVRLLLGPTALNAGDTVVFQIPRNASSAEIAAILAENGLIRSPLAFRVYARYAGADAALKAGEYEVRRGLSVPETIEALRTGGQDKTVDITIPEGYNTGQILDLLRARGLVGKKEFMAAAGSAPWIYAPDDMPADRRLEGYLFPDTFAVPEDADAAAIIGMLLDRFAQEARALHLAEKAEKMGFSVHEMVTIASLIEREARIDGDRRLISGVIHNRLRMGMPLQVDATVVYALGETARERVSYADLEVDSPYNTYRYPGLPPGPIANPGADSLRAALDPAPTDYVYYLAKPDGRHVFSRTLAEHNAAKQQYID